MSHVGLELEVGAPTAAEMPAALKLLLSDLPADRQLDQLVAWRDNYAAQTFAGLLVARRGRQVVGAVWPQIVAGTAANIWPPRMVAGESINTLAGLVRHAVQWLASQPVRVGQVLLAAAETDTAAALHAQGFEHVADLTYLVAIPTAVSPTAAAATPLQVESIATVGEARLAAVIEQTYTDTLDCPRLNGTRPIDEVLAGYRSVGRFDPKDWMIFRHDGQDVGCLLLHEHPGGSWELGYMGLMPEARGRGWGAAIVRYALAHAAASAGKQLVLAVDKRNRPAVAMYQSCGFAAWDERSAYVRFFAIAQV